MIIFNYDLSKKLESLGIQNKTDIFQLSQSDLYYLKHNYVYHLTHSPARSLYRDVEALMVHMSVPLLIRMMPSLHGNQNA